MENYLHHSLVRNCKSSFNTYLALASLQQLFPPLIPKTKNTLHQIAELSRNVIDQAAAVSGLRVRYL